MLQLEILDVAGEMQRRFPALRLAGEFEASKKVLKQSLDCTCGADGVEAAAGNVAGGGNYGVDVGSQSTMDGAAVAGGTMLS
jgi:hypothetical protein